MAKRCSLVTLARRGRVLKIMPGEVAMRKSVVNHDVSEVVISQVKRSY